MPYFGIPIRNGLPIGLGSVAGFGIAPFSPESLFENGEVGAWYDPSDYSTLFTDSAGTTPVTGVEQFVGLMLDKSKGLVLGPELVTNGDFSGGSTDWSLGSGWSIVGGQAVNGGGGTGQLRQLFPSMSVGWYVVEFDATVSASQVNVILETTSIAGITSSGHYKYIIYIASTSFPRIYFGPNGGFVGSIDNISVRELPGNHAFQTSSAKRPKLAARYNLLTYSEEFDNGAWTTTNATVTANTVVAPDGTLTGDKLVENALLGVHRVRSVDYNGTAGQLITYSVYLKAGERTFAYLSSNFSDRAEDRVAIDLTTGQLAVPVGSVVNYSAVDVGNGWWRLVVTQTKTSTAAKSFWVGSSVGLGSADSSYTGDGTSGIYIWGADLRPASQATGLIGPTYQRVAAATVYDTAGFLPYLAFDGLDDSMSTNSIDFSAGDKMTVWAGVRKLSDAALGLVAELSATANTNGAFFLAAPRDATTANYSVLLASTANLDARITTFAAPITNVITASLDIAGATNADEVAIRANGVAQTPSYAGSNGTGNFGNHPLYIGARNNASLFFNGWLTSLIVRGAQSTQSQIEATEAWVNSRTGAY